MKTRNAFKRFSAFLLALVMILCEMPAISARAAEGDKPFTGAETFEIVTDDFEIDVTFDEGWSSEESGGTVYYANFGYWFPEDVRPTLADFAAEFSQIHAEFKVIDLQTEGTVSVGNTVLNLIRELPEEEQTDGPYDYTWPGVATDGPAILSEGNLEYTADFSDFEFDNDVNWLVESISMEFVSTDINATFGLRNTNWTAPVYVNFTGEEDYNLISDEWYNNTIEFNDDWSDENGYYSMLGDWSLGDKNITLADFAARYGHILIETKIPKLAEDNHISLINVAIEYKENLYEEEGEIRRVEKQLSDYFFAEGSNSQDIDITDAQYDEKYGDWYVCSIIIDVFSDTETSIRLLYKDAEIPEVNKLYLSTDWDWENVVLPEDAGTTSDIYVTCGVGENIILMYYAEDEEGNLLAKPVSIAGESASMFNEDLKIYYQADEESEKELCNAVLNYNTASKNFDPMIVSDEPYNISYAMFGKTGIYTIESVNEEYAGTVTVYSCASDWGFYREDNSLATSLDTFTRKSGETITLVPSDKEKEYSVIVLDYLGYGSDGVSDRNFVTAKDSEGNDVTGKLCFTNAQILEQDDLAGYSGPERALLLGELPVLKGDTSFTLTDFAHNYMTIIVRYEGEDGYECSWYEWAESEESRDMWTRTPQLDPGDEVLGFTGYIVNEAEYRSGNIDWHSGEPLAEAYGASMKEVIDKLSQAMRDGKATNYGYIWLESAFVVNDPVSYGNSRNEQFISSDIGGVADINGVIILATANMYTYNLEYTPEFIRAVAEEMGETGDIDGHEYAYAWFKDMVDEEDPLIFPTAFQWARNVANTEENIFLLPATTDNEYGFYILNGNLDEGFTITDPVVEVQKEYGASGVSFPTIYNHNDGKYYEVMGWYGIYNEFPKLHVDATNEVFLLGNFADVPEGEANIFMKLAEGSKTIINGDIYTLTEDGKVNVLPRNGAPAFILENGEITASEGSYDHWQLGTVDYNYTVLVDKLEIKTNADFSGDTNVDGAESDYDVNSMYNQITNGLTEEEKKKVDGGNNITLETNVTDVTGNDIPGAMGNEINKLDPKSAEYIDISLEYFVGYGNDAGSKITETDDAVYLTITLKGDDYDDNPERYIIGRYHEGVYEELVPENVTLIEGGVEVTFKSDKFSVYAIVYGANRKTVSIGEGTVATVYTYGDEPVPDGLTITVDMEDGTSITYASNETAELGYKWILFASNGKEATKDKAGNYPVGTYKWVLADDEGNTVATCDREIIIRMEYTITYMLAGGTKKNEAAFITSYYSDAEGVVLPTTSDFEDEPDYVFGGWYTSASYKESELVTAIAPETYKNYVLYAKWIARKITVKFNANGGNNGGSTSTLTLYNRKKATLSANGYKDKTRAFMGWALTADATDVVFANKESVILSTSSDVSGGEPYAVTAINGLDITSYIVDDTLTLHAVWEKIFSITYISEGVEYKTDAYTYGKTKKLDTTIKTTKPGYTFGGWYTEAGKKLTEISKTSTGDLVLTAKWTANKYTVKYNKNVSKGVTGKMSDSKFTYDAEGNLRANAFKRPGYKLLGWNTDKTAETALYEDGAAVSNLAKSGTVTLYAIWAPTTYTMSFDPMCAVEDISGGEIADITYSYSSTKGTTLPKPVRSDYTFVGWYKETSYKNQVKSTKSLSSDITVFARWSTKYDIHFDGNGGISTTEMTDMVGVDFATAKSLKENKYSYKDVSGNAYAFMGWDTDSEGTNVVYTNKQKVSYPSAMTKVDDKFVLNLYAVWENEWNVNYMLNGGNLPEDAARTYVYKKGLSKLPTPEKDGYTFAGWYKDGKFKTKVTSISTSSTKDVTFYAKWTPKSYSVTFNANVPTGRKSSGTMKKQTLNYGTSKALSKNKFKITGYTFLGWSTSSDATEPEFTNSQKVADFGDFKSSVTLYAIWEMTEYKVTYKMGGIREDVVEYYTIDSGYSLIEAPVKLGYTFQGFYTDSKFKKKAANLKTGTTGDKVIYVKWTQNK